jgi:hypothetical protein
MRVDFFGLAFESAQVTVHLWSPWRASALEHRLFEAVGQALRAEPESGPDELRLVITDPKSWRTALQALSRVLKGWQEEAVPGGGERRTWCWLLEGDTDANGYDHAGEPTSLWGIIRVGIDRGSPGEGEKGEDIDLEGFGIRIGGASARN